MKCPICSKPTVAAMRPFCSKGCADIDLHRWFSGAYTVPVSPDADEDGSKGDGLENLDNHGGDGLKE